MNFHRLILPAALLLLAGCATLPPGQRDARDPYERFNRSMYRFNTAADRALLRPVGRFWRATVPPPVRQGLSNFTDNLAYPKTILNDFLQGKFADGGRDVTRLIINTVCGLGLFDPATAAGLERHDEDFGQTLGKWGVHSGPYLVLPLLGPSTVRDTPTKVLDDYGDGRHYLTDSYARWGLWVTSKAELRAKLLDSDEVLERTFDPYAFVRSAWLQRREFQVHDGNVVGTGGKADAPPDEEVPPPD
jgi:phospholipid-binding lipoprotein MlaA